MFYICGPPPHTHTHSQDASDIAFNPAIDQTWQGRQLGSASLQVSFPAALLHVRTKSRKTEAF